MDVGRPAFHACDRGGTRADRAARIHRNAAAFGVPALEVLQAAAPAALASLPPPDAIFIGGGASEPGVLDAAIAALRPGGRLVVNAVTLETEALLIAQHAAFGGELIRIAISRAGAVGEKTGWRSAMPVTQWIWTKAWTSHDRRRHRMQTRHIGARHRSGDPGSACPRQYHAGRTRCDCDNRSEERGGRHPDGGGKTRRRRRHRAGLGLTLAGDRIETRSERVLALTGLGSVAEAAALAAAGPSAKLISPRLVMGSATCALAASAPTSGAAS